MDYDNVNHPYHYTHTGLECIDVMEKIFGIVCVKHFCLCNAFKYLFRCNFKHKQLEDIKKARWYLDKFIQLQEKENLNEVQNTVDK